MIFDDCVDFVDFMDGRELLFCEHPEINSVDKSYFRNFWTDGHKISGEINRNFGKIYKICKIDGKIDKICQINRFWYNRTIDT